MHRPYRNRNGALVVAVLGAAVGAACALAPERTVPVELAMAGGFTVAALGLMFAFFSHIEGRRHARLLRGENVLARWTVGREWAAKMAEIDERLGKERNALQNYLFPRPGGGGEIEVVIATEAVMVGGDFHSMPVRGFAQVHGPFFTAAQSGGNVDGGGLLEFHLKTFGSANSSPRQWALRIPVPPGHGADVQRVHAHYRTRPENNARPTNARRRRAIGLWIAGVMGVLCAASLALLPFSQEWPEQPKNLLLLGAIAGAVFTLMGLLIAAVWHGRGG